MSFILVNWMQVQRTLLEGLQFLKAVELLRIHLHVQIEAMASSNHCTGVEFLQRPEKSAVPMLI